ncbi:MAG: helix-turn-helix transcriptional regulator [Anaerovoracaceae bacterium]
MYGSKEETNIIVGRKIKSLRLEKHMTLERLAESSGLSIQTIKQIERGKRSCTVWSLICIAKVFAVSTQFLVESHHSYVSDDLKILMESLTPAQIELSRNLLYAVKMSKIGDE